MKNLMQAQIVAIAAPQTAEDNRSQSIHILLGDRRDHADSNSKSRRQ
jgi:hypothetical protein